MSLLPASLARRAATLAAVLALVLVAGCGSDETVSPTSIDSLGSGIERTPVTDSPEAEAEARKLMNARLERWFTYLRAEWGVKPTTRYTLLNEDVDRWRIEGRIRGDDPDERILGEWLIYLPLDSPSELEGLSRADRQVAIEPVGDEARQLDAPPPTLPGNSASLSGSIEVDDDAFELEIDQVSASADDAARRGREAIGNDPDATMRITPGPGTRITTAAGDPLTVAQFRSTIDDVSALPSQVTVTWQLSRPVRTRSDLAGATPARIVLTKP